MDESHRLCLAEAGYCDLRMAKQRKQELNWLPSKLLGKDVDSIFSFCMSNVCEKIGLVELT